MVASVAYVILLRVVLEVPILMLLPPPRYVYVYDTVGCANIAAQNNECGRIRSGHASHHASHLNPHSLTAIRENEDESADRIVSILYDYDYYCIILIWGSTGTT
jgi:hypothetical protein